MTKVTKKQRGNQALKVQEKKNEEASKIKPKDEEKAKRQKEDAGKKKVKDVLVTVNEAEITEVDETKQPCSLVFIGHVDAGKSTICGNMMYQMGVVDERTI